MDIMDASSEAEWIDEGDIISQSPVDAILPYQVPTTDIEPIQLFQALHRPHQRISFYLNLGQVSHLQNRRLQR